MCQLFKVSRSGFYSFISRPLSLQQKSNHHLDQLITTIFHVHKKRYGAPRITRALRAKK
jgi:hypothetical protein